MNWWDRITNRDMLSDIQAGVWKIQSEIIEMGRKMADTSTVLNEVSEGLRTLGPRIADLLTENDALRKRNAELEGEDVAESDAAVSVKSAYDGVVAAFDQTDEAPTPDKLPQTDPAFDGAVPVEGQATESQPPS